VRNFELLRSSGTSPTTKAGDDEPPGLGINFARQSRLGLGPRSTSDGTGRASAISPGGGSGGGGGGLGQVLSGWSKPLVGRRTSLNKKRQSAQAKLQLNDTTGSTAPPTPIEPERPLDQLTGLDPGFSRSFSSFFDEEKGVLAGLGIGRPDTTTRGGRRHSSRSPSASSEPWGRPRTGSSDVTATTADSFDVDAQIANAVHNMAGPLGASPVLQDDKSRNADELEGLLRIPCNSVCADCGRAGKWAEGFGGFFTS
jgi:hypothetical protein